MFNIGPEELLLILVIALVFVGPKRLPDMARQVGKGLREFRNITGSAKRELMDSVQVDLNAQPRAEGLADGDVPLDDDTPVDISSLPVWDGTQDQPQVPGVNAPAVVSAPSNGNGSKTGKPGSKPKKKKPATAEGAGAPPTQSHTTSGPDATGAPAHEATEPVAATQAVEPTEAIAPTAEPSVADAPPQPEQTAPLEVPPPAAVVADDAPGDGTETTVPTTDPVEP